MSAETSRYPKRSQPFPEAAIVVFILLTLWTLAVLYGCFKNASHLNYTALWQYGFFNGFTLPLFIVLPLELVTLITGLHFIFRKKIIGANICPVYRQRIDLPVISLV
jgi:hypothetical protein